MAHLAVIPYADLEDVALADPDTVRLARVSRPGPLPYDHPEILSVAKKELRRQYADHPDPGHLPGPRFTVHELPDVHLTIAGPTRQKDTFRRAMEPRLAEGRY